MFQQPFDFQDECDALYALLDDRAAADFERVTQFKSWSVNDVLVHLHVWNKAADQALTDPEGFQAYLAALAEGVKKHGAMRGFENEFLPKPRGPELLALWQEQYRAMVPRFAEADPKKRVAWAGPDMSVRSSITARLMETWAHGQEIYDVLGVERVNGDRIKNIAVLGINTFGWTYKTRREPVPDYMPYVRLTAPSGEIWEWNEPSDADYVAGPAEAFCQTVTQVRNVADTALEVVGPVASDWMSKAQCFAGAPAEPPLPGARHRQAA